MAFNVAEIIMSDDEMMPGSSDSESGSDDLHELRFNSPNADTPLHDAIHHLRMEKERFSNLEANTQNCLLVHHCQAFGNLKVASLGIPQYTYALNAFLKCLPKFQNLAHLSLTQMTITSVAGVALQNLSQLQELRFVECNIHYAQNIKLDLRVFEAILQTVTLPNGFDPRKCSTVQFFTPRQLEMLTIADPEMFRTYTNARIFNFPKLTCLTLDCGIVAKEVLYRFLGHCSLLTSLTLLTGWSVDQNYRSGYLPSSSIPNLSHFEGRPELFHLITTGRPIKSLVLMAVRDVVRDSNISANMYTGMPEISQHLRAIASTLTSIEVAFDIDEYYTSRPHLFDELHNRDIYPRLVNTTFLVDTNRPQLDHTWRREMILNLSDEADLHLPLDYVAAPNQGFAAWQELFLYLEKEAHLLLSRFPIGSSESHTGTIPTLNASALSSIINQLRVMPPPQSSSATN